MCCLTDYLGRTATLLFAWPNGSGKGTQGAVVQKKFNIAHIESGLIFRENIKIGTDLGKKSERIY